MPITAHPTEEEIMFLKANYRSMGVNNMCAKLGRGKEVVNRWLRELHQRGEIDLHSAIKLKTAKQDPSKLQWSAGIDLQRVW